MALREEIVAAARSLVGAPFASRARGPHAYDCVGVVIALARQFQTVPWGWDFTLSGQVKELIRQGGFRPLPGAREKAGPPLLGDLVIWGRDVARGVCVVTEEGADPLVVASISGLGGVVERRLSELAAGSDVFVTFEFDAWTAAELQEFDETGTLGG